MLDWDEPNAAKDLALLDDINDAFSRRQFVHHGAAALAGLAGAGLVDPAVVLARANAGPRPIPGGLDMNGKPVAKDPFVHVL